MSRSLFSRITKYQPRLLFNPRENRITEVTAALLEQSARFRRGFLDYLLSDSGASARFRDKNAGAERHFTTLHKCLAALGNVAATVTTQHPTLGGRFVDLVVRADGSGSAPGLLVWIEIKDASDLHGDQLDAYVAEIGREAAGKDACVVLLVPRGWRTKRRIPSSVLVGDWQGVADVAKQAEADDDDSKTTWLLREYRRFLEEEQLSEAEHRPLDQFSARALMEHDSVEGTAWTLCEWARDVVTAKWGPPAVDNKSGEPVAAKGLEDFWIQFNPYPKDQPSSQDWGNAWLEFGFRGTADTDGLEAVRGDYYLMAGVTFYSKTEVAEAMSDEAWMAARMFDGFQRFQVDGWHRLARVCYPDELIEEKTLNAQAQKLGAWVLDTFTALADNPPQR